MNGISPLSAAADPLSTLNSGTGYDTGIYQPMHDAQSSAAGGKTSTAAVDKIASDFEAVFLSQMMGAMFSGDELTSYFGGGTTGEIYKSFLMDQYGKAFSQSGGIGIASEVRKELLSLQEAS